MSEESSMGDTDKNNTQPQAEPEAEKPASASEETDSSARTPQPQSTSSRVKGPYSKKQKLIAIIIAALAAAGAIAFGVYAYVTNTPDYMLSKSLEQFGKETAVAARYSIINNAENGVSVEGDVAARGEPDGKKSEVAVGVGSGDSRVTVAARFIDDTVYMRFGNLENFVRLAKKLNPEQSGIVESPELKDGLARVNSKWFSLTKEETASFTKLLTKSNAGNANFQDMQKTYEMYKKHAFLKVNQTLPDETIDGTATAHLTLKVDKPAYKAFLEELKAAHLQSVPVSDDDLKNADKDAEEVGKNVALNVWVTRDSKKLKQVKMTSTEKGNEGTISFTFKTDLPPFEPLDKPADATPFSEFISTFLGPAYAPRSSAPVNNYPMPL